MSGKDAFQTKQQLVLFGSVSCSGKSCFLRCKLVANSVKLGRTSPLRGHLLCRREMSRRPSSDASFEAADSECRPPIPTEKCGSVAEAVAIAVIKEHVAALIAGNGAARSSRRVTPLSSHTVVLGSAPPLSQETKPSLPAFSQGLAAKPQGLGSCRHTAWFSETSHCSPIGSDEKSLPPAFEK